MMSVLPDPDQKAEYVNAMFTDIAQRYDVMNRLMTFGLDQGWRRWALRHVGSAPVNTLLDVGAGTGDFVHLARELFPMADVVGVDFTLAMLQAGLGRLAGSSAVFVNGDALALPFDDSAFDVVTTGFTMRNVLDIKQAFAEMARVTKPGGRLACLEVARPTNALVRWGHRFYFNSVVPLIGAAVGGNKTAYTYLPQSADAFPQPPELATIIESAGWHDVSWQRLGFGAVAVHLAIR